MRHLKNPTSADVGKAVAVRGPDRIQLLHPALPGFIPDDLFVLHQTSLGLAMAMGSTMTRRTDWYGTACLLYDMHWVGV